MRRLLWCSIPFKLQNLAVSTSRWCNLYANKLNILVVDDNELRGNVICRQLAARESVRIPGSMTISTLLEAAKLNFFYDIYMN